MENLLKAKLIRLKGRTFTPSRDKKESDTISGPDFKAIGVLAIGSKDDFKVDLSYVKKSSLYAWGTPEYKKWERSEKRVVALKYQDNGFVEVVKGLGLEIEFSEVEKRYRKIVIGYRKAKRAKAKLEAQKLWDNNWAVNEIKKLSNTDTRYKVKTNYETKESFVRAKVRCGYGCSPLCLEIVWTEYSDTNVHQTRYITLSKEDNGKYEYQCDYLYGDYRTRGGKDLHKVLDKIAQSITEKNTQIKREREHSNKEMLERQGVVSRLNSLTNIHFAIDRESHFNRYNKSYYYTIQYTAKLNEGDKESKVVVMTSDNERHGLTISNISEEKLTAILSILQENL